MQLQTPMIPRTEPSDATWHRTLGALIEALDKPHFWNVVIRTLRDHVAFDSWVVLRFSRSGSPLVYAENPQADGSADPLFAGYLNGFYLLDPFYIAGMDELRSGLVRLDDVAPDLFEFEDYHERYFKHNVVADEVQFNLPLADGELLALSLGSARRYTPADIALLQLATPWLLALMRQRMAIEMRHSPHAAPPPPQGPQRVAHAAGLTVRELEIMQLLLSGVSSKGISQKLNISPETVKAHRKHVYTKMGVKSHPELFALYLRSKEST
jgi:DNA-binding CsgD family transcriptional regulator